MALSIIKSSGAVLTSLIPCTSSRLALCNADQICPNCSLWKANVTLIVQLIHNYEHNTNPHTPRVIGRL